MSQVIRELSYSSCQHGRLGGEEFAAVWFDASVDDARAQAEALRAGVETLRIMEEEGLLANAAQANCFEALPFFIGALLLAQQMGAPQHRVDVLAVGFILLRSVYVALYLADRAGLRSLVWVAALAVNIALLFSGG